MAKKSIKINLDESTHAKDFKNENLIHQNEFDKVLSIINGFIPDTEEKAQKENLHNTITIFGSRGSGKTSFLLSIKKEIERYDDKYLGNLRQVKVLDIIDPTLIEEKGHVFLNVISAISELVLDKLEKSELRPQQDMYLKKEWRSSLIKLADGLPSIDGIGNNNTDAWQDPEYVMDRGLMAVTASRNLAKNFNEFLRVSLQILNRQAFLLLFDDIDVDSSKGWAVLETIRKYFTGARLVTILSGDLKLYTTVVRQKKWENFGREILKYEGQTAERLEAFNDKVTELTGQYLLKIMQPSLRISLTTLLEKRNTRDALSLIVVYGGKEEEIVNRYAAIFESFGIINSSQLYIYQSFLLSLPLRTQIQFFRIMQGDNGMIENEDITNIFLSDLLEKGVDINLANNAPKYLNGIIVKLLLKERRLNDLYLIQPVSVDSSLNSSLFSLNIILSNNIKQNNKFLIFDYFIRIGYLRNLISIIPHKNVENKNQENPVPSIEDISSQSGIFNDNSLRDVTGHMHGYVYGSLEFSNSNVANITNSFIRLYGLRQKSQNIGYDRLDAVFSDNLKHGQPARILGYMPAFIGVYSYKNESRVGFSIYMLLASIGEIIKRHEASIAENNPIASKMRIKSALLELGQLRTYPIANFTKSFFEEREELGQIREDKEERINDNNNDLEIFVELLFRWMDRIREGVMAVSPHLLGRISTRFFNAVSNLQQNYVANMKLGEVFKYHIIAFFNAVLIEDIRENTKDFSFLNINNSQFSESIFYNNLRNAVNRELKNKLDFSRWVLSCPLLVSYLPINSNVNDLLASYCEKEFSFFREQQIDVYNLLNQVSILNPNRTVSIRVVEATPDILKKPGNLVDLLKKSGIPYQWFISDTKNNKGNNLYIKEHIGSVFGNDADSARKIREFRKFILDNKITW